MLNSLHHQHHNLRLLGPQIDLKIVGPVSLTAIADSRVFVHVGPFVEAVEGGHASFQ